MTTYWYAVVPEYKLLLSVGGSHFDRDNYMENVDIWSKLDWEDIYMRVCDVYDVFSKDVSEFTLTDISIIVKNLEAFNSYMDGLTEYRQCYAIHTLFGDKVTDVICENGDAYHKYIKTEKYKVID